MKEEALGSGLHPWEFFEYTLQEYMLRRSGIAKARRIELQQEFQHFRVLARYVVMPYLSTIDKNKTLDKLVPDIYESKQAEDLENRYQTITEKYKKLGILQ